MAIVYPLTGPSTNSAYMVTILESPNRIPGGSIGRAGSSDSKKLRAIANANSSPISANRFTFWLRFCAAMRSSSFGHPIILDAFLCFFKHSMAFSAFLIIKE